jgi:methanogenic corrinoid protein MtbC1
LVQGDRDGARAIFDAALAQEPSIPSVYQGLFQPALYRVGELWESGQITVATEHMATAITEELMNAVYQRLINPVRSGHKVIIATVEEEEHQVGAKMASDLFEMHGWDAIFPGAGITTSELLALIGREQPAMLGLSFSIAAHSATLLSMLQRIRERYPRLPILVGGQGLRWTDTAAWSDLDNVVCIASLDALDAHIRQLDPAVLGADSGFGATPIGAPEQD